MSSLASEDFKQNEGKNCVCVPSLISLVVSVVVKSPCLLTLCALKVSAFKVRASVSVRLCVHACICVFAYVCVCMRGCLEGWGAHARLFLHVCVCVCARARVFVFKLSP